MKRSASNPLVQSDQAGNSCVAAASINAFPVRIPTRRLRRHPQGLQRGTLVRISNGRQYPHMPHAMLHHGQRQACPKLTASRHSNAGAALKQSLGLQVRGGRQAVEASPA